MVAKYAHKENGVRASKTKRAVWSKYNFLKKPIQAKYATFIGV